MYSGKPLKAHIELSNKCNAMCPQCGRNTSPTKGELRMQPGLQTTELRLEDIEKIFDDEFWDTHTLTHIRFVGNYSDPIATKDLHEIVEFFILNNPQMRVTISTNGSLKTEDWWYHFGRLMSSTYNKGKTRKVIFGLDGTDDVTHALYRHRTNYDKIIRNAKSFISAGGNAEWSFLVFKHNEHQIDEAKRLSKEYGFKKFNTVWTTRFHSGRGYKQYTLDGVEYKLQETTKRQMPNLSKIPWPPEDVGISCKVLQEDYEEIFVDYTGEIVPCCWIGSALQRWRTKDTWTLTTHPPEDDALVSEILKDDSHNAIKYGATKVMKNQWFTKLKESWVDKPCRTCYRICNKKLNLKKEKDGEVWV